jgi:type II secretory ATPase GspE/PulE/Tfp pilus assembly ATPase PilB-like protein
MNETERAKAEIATHAWADQINIPYFDTTQPIEAKPLLGKLTLEGMMAYQIVPLAINGTALTVGINDKTDRTQIENLRARLSAYQVTFNVISQAGWHEIYNRMQLGVNQSAIEGNYDNFAQRVNNAEPKQQFDVIAQLAYQLGASDIHLEPAETRARVRFRIDGTLHPIITLSHERYDLLTSDLQMRAGAKWGGDVPQAGRISLDLISPEGVIAPVNMRLETIPSLHGQDVVIRLFTLNVAYLKLAALALSQTQRTLLEKVISHPRGLVLTVGPTGSGKTSSLYAIINQLNAPEVKIVTLEDPVEYELIGVSQLPVRSEDSQLFMDKLRAVLREDPNIIMIGEIRDADTAKTALQAALTGHLVLSTFHASSSASAVTRLMDMIGENPLLASSVRLIMAQRLLRRLCPDCRQSAIPTKDELLEIKTALHELPVALQPDYDTLKLNHPKGCEKCHNFGYRGRIGLFEQLEITPAMEELISRGNTAATTLAIETLAIKEGMITLLQDGVFKAISGETSLEEVYSAVGA